MTSMYMDCERKLLSKNKSQINRGRNLAKIKDDPNTSIKNYNNENACVLCADGIMLENASIGNADNSLLDYLIELLSNGTRGIFKM